MKNGTPYSPYKIFHHRPWIDAMKNGDHPAPIFVELMPTNRCNQRCTHCAYRDPGYSSNETFDPRDEIPFSKLAEVVEDCAGMGVRAIEITGGGEPMLHRDFHRLTKLILDTGLDLGLVTNGSLWDASSTDVMSRAKWVRFSLDAGTAKTYAATRHSYEDVYARVRRAVKDLASTHGPLVGVSFVVTRENWKEILEASYKAKEDGANNVRISAMFQNQGAVYFADFQEQATALCHLASEELDDGDKGFRVFNLFGDRVEDLKAGRPDYVFCGFQRACTIVGADQRVYRCCVLAYNEQGRLGSIQDQSFREMWNSPKTRKLFDDFDARGCPRCMFNGKNTTIAYAVNPNPMHVNFV